MVVRFFDFCQSFWLLLGLLISLYQNDLISIGVVVRTFWFLVAVIVFWFLWYFLLTVGLLELLWEVFGCCQTIFIVSDCCLSLIVVLFCSVSECSICFHNFLIVGVVVRAFWLLSEFSVGFLWQNFLIVSWQNHSRSVFKHQMQGQKRLFKKTKCKKRFCGKKNATIRIFWLWIFSTCSFLKMLTQSENSDNNQKILTTLDNNFNNQNNRWTTSTIRKFWQQSENSDNTWQQLQESKQSMNNFNNQKILTTIRKILTTIRKILTTLDNNFNNQNNRWTTSTIRKFWQQSEKSDNNQKILTTIRKFWQQSDTYDILWQQSENSNNNQQSNKSVISYQKILTTIYNYQNT